MTIPKLQDQITRCYSFCSSHSFSPTRKPHVFPLKEITVDVYGKDYTYNISSGKVSYYKITSGDYHKGYNTELDYVHPITEENLYHDVLTSVHRHLLDRTIAIAKACLAQKYLATLDIEVFLDDVQ